MRMTRFMVLSLVVLGFSISAQSETFVVGVSPFQNKAVHKEQSKRLLQYLTRLKTGDKAIIVDAYHLKTLGHFTIPDGKAYQSPKARLGKNGNVVQALLSLPETIEPKNNTVVGAVRLPQFLRYVAQNYHETDKRVVVLGSPFYDVPEDRGFSMVDGLIPGDEHILVSRDTSVFGTADVSGLLKDWQVFFVYGDDVKILGDRHHFYLNRFWTLFIEAQGGKLVTFTNDLVTALEGLKNGVRSIPHHFKLDNTERLEMMRVQEVKPEISIYERELSTQMLMESQLRNAAHVEIGLTWECACDLDLYARPYSRAGVLFFQNTRTKDGVYFKDFRNSPRLSNGFETIAFHKSVDLTQLQIVVNFFSGTAPQGVRGEIRIAVNGQTYAKPFELKGTMGNKGQGIQYAFTPDPRNLSHIAIIDPLSIVLHQQQ